MDDKKNFKKVEETNNIIIENRRKLSISGVEDVDSFDEVSIVMFTTMGMLTIKGQDLHINRLNIEIGDISIEGTIDEIIYSDAEDKRNAQGFFSKLFK